MTKDVSKVKYLQRISAPDVTAEIASARTRGEVLTAQEARQRIYQRRKRFRAQYGWYRALAAERQFREQRDGCGHDA